MKTAKGLTACGLAIVCFIFPLNAQTRWENPVKKLLREGKPVVGLTVTIPSPDVALQAARLGFDFLWIEMEHSGITLESLRHIILATNGTACMPITRVPVNELWTAKRALDAGSMGVIFPFTSTPELARQAVAACRYPPAGLRGFGPGLASLRWPAPEGYRAFADTNVLVIVIIEQAQAVERIDEIASVPGIDVLFIGPNDLSFSLGLQGRQDEPKLKEAIAKVLVAGKRHGVAVGRTAGPDQIGGLIKEGFQFFQASSELGMMAAGSRSILEAAGKSAPSKDRPMY
ncbi:MAG: HpcH/HpaI aldolase/citrate lyase family protein [Acidobacteriota bacterium]